MVFQIQPGHPDEPVECEVGEALRLSAGPAEVLLCPGMVAAAENCERGHGEPAPAVRSARHAHRLRKDHAASQPAHRGVDLGPAQRGHVGAAWSCARGALDVEGVEPELDLRPAIERAIRALAGS